MLVKENVCLEVYGGPDLSIASALRNCARFSPAAKPETIASAVTDFKADHRAFPANTPFRLLEYLDRERVTRREGDERESFCERVPRGRSANRIQRAR